MSALFGLLSLCAVVAAFGGLALLGVWLFKTARRNHQRRLAWLWAFASKHDAPHAHRPAVPAPYEIRQFEPVYVEMGSVAARTPAI